ncbi:hypothetical protein C0Q44_26255 [Paenibacillus sp. PCH8]|uniref:DUF2971 domain-containing protein n=1 Tax=Paenibacillus sp. PCH8 TaxID=2066524 RepID=UPI000CFA2806|nr:DUF2971 domain-containing protein [Paenibacillus sp. PCH8]PQP80733.1 hypothetical protein C0Q44_26255 [Paenibacillus sp. PCH8]
MIKIYTPFRNNISDPNKYLYHYTTSNTALQYILANAELRFSPLNKTNDPKESIDWEFNYRLDSNNRDADFPPIADLFKDKLQHHCKVVCFTRDDPKKFNTGHSLIIHRGYCRPRMWAQYAENHAGICLVFDKQKLNDSILSQLNFLGDIYQGSIKYKDFVGQSDAFSLDCSKILKLGAQEFFNYHTRKYLKPLIFEKQVDWKSELEYSWALISASITYEYFSIEEAICGVVLGEDFPVDSISDVLKFTKLYRVPVVQLEWRNGYPAPTTLEGFIMESKTFG